MMNFSKEEVASYIAVVGVLSVLAQVRKYCEKVKYALTLFILSLLVLFLEILGP